MKNERMDTILKNINEELKKAKFKSEIAEQAFEECVEKYNYKIVKKFFPEAEEHPGKTITERIDVELQQLWRLNSDILCYLKTISRIVYGAHAELASKNEEAKGEFNPTAQHWRAEAKRKKPNYGELYCHPSKLNKDGYTC